MNDKLIRIQKELKAPKNNRNTFGNYNYRSAEDILEAVKPLVHKQGLSLVLSDEVVCIGESNYVKSVAKIIEGTEQISAFAFAREATTKKGMDDAQITGSASSYARKYALNGLFAIDDTKDADTDQHRSQLDNKVNSDKLAKAKQELYSEFKKQGITDSQSMNAQIQLAIGKDSVETAEDAKKVIKHLDEDN